jgi:hypothetical protein
MLGIERRQGGAGHGKRLRGRELRLGRGGHGIGRLRGRDAGGQREGDLQAGERAAPFAGGAAGIE